MTESSLLVWVLNVEAMASWHCEPTAVSKHVLCTIASLQCMNPDFEAARKRHGERKFYEDAIIEEDLVKLPVKELDGDDLKEDGKEDEDTEENLLSEKVQASIDRQKMRLRLV